MAADNGQNKDGIGKRPQGLDLTNLDNLKENIAPKQSSSVPKQAEAQAPKAQRGRARPSRNGKTAPVKAEKAPVAPQKGKAAKPPVKKQQPKAPVKQAAAPADRKEAPAKRTGGSRQSRGGNGRESALLNAAKAAAALIAGQEAEQKQEQKAQKSRGGSAGKGKGKAPTVRIIPLGGLHEVGKNLTCIECGNDLFIIDCGLSFPDSEMLGVDIVIPDFTYLERNKDRLRGIVITHGHEDHIGSIPYLLKKLNAPIYGTRLTIGLIEGKLKEHNLLSKAKLNVVVPRQTVSLGCMTVEFIRVNHSIPDAVALAIHTPAGVIVHTGDFKVDFTPIEGGVIDLARFGELGNQGVLLMMSESTNAERPGFTPTERKVGESFHTLFGQAQGKRIIIATFSSNIHRVQQIVDNAAYYGRRVVVSGRSMINVVTKALELGYLRIPEGLLAELDDIGRIPPEKLVLITTGSQGEPMSALTRMAMHDHRKVSITPQDFIIISATPIPGNEKFVSKVVNELLKSGAEVIYEKMYDVHVSGHACQDELKMMISLVKPKFFIPVHGEYKHLMKHASLAKSMGIPEQNIHISEIGEVVEVSEGGIKPVGQVPSGRVLVDGLGVGDVGAIVLRDRKHLAEDGLIIAVVAIESESGTVVSGPDLVSRGFVYVREAEELMENAKKQLAKVLKDCADRDVREWGVIKQRMRDALSDYIFSTTKRSPMILPVIMEI